MINKHANSQLIELEQLVNYYFKDKSLLIEALSHPSLKQQQRGVTTHKNYERLELLGDAILGFIITEFIFKNFSESDEGSLAKIRSNLVCKDMLCRVAAKIKLAGFIIMTEGEEISGGRSNPNNIENVMEALIAAIYLDSDIHTVGQIIQNLWQEFFSAKDLSQTDSKTALQEWSQSHGFNKPVYKVIDKSGPDHLPNFVVSAGVGDDEETAEGHTIKNAEKIAAGKLLKRLASKDH